MKDPVSIRTDEPADSPESSADPTPRSKLASQAPSGQGKARLPELITLVLLIVACGGAMFWFDSDARRSQRESEARLEGIIAQQAARIGRLEADLAEVNNVLQLLGEALPAFFKLMNDRLAESNRFSAKKLRESPEQKPVQSARPAAKPPTASENMPPAHVLQQMRQQLRQRLTDLPAINNDRPGQMRLEDIKSPALRKAVQSARAFEKELQKELENDFTDKQLPADDDEIYSSGFIRK